MSQDCLVYSPREVGEIFGLRVDTIYRKIRSGQLPSVQIGTRRYVPKAAIERLLGAVVNKEEV